MPPKRNKLSAIGKRVLKQDKSSKCETGGK